MKVTCMFADGFWSEVDVKEELGSFSKSVPLNPGSMLPI